MRLHFLMAAILKYLTEGADLILNSLCDNQCRGDRGKMIHGAK